MSLIPVAPFNTSTSAKRFLAIRSSVHMPLEPCPACGYALSTVDHHCRHCATASRAIALQPSIAKHLQQMIIMGVVVLSVLVYLIFFR